MALMDRDCFKVGDLIINIEHADIAISTDEAAFYYRKEVSNIPRNGPIAVRKEHIDDLIYAIQRAKKIIIERDSK